MKPNFLLVLLILFFIFYTYIKNKVHYETYNNPQYNTHFIKGKIVSSPEKIKKGLMFRMKKLKIDEGMLFDMGKYDKHSFWMKNTFIGLDILFLDKNKKVLGYVENNKPESLDKIKINRPSYYILEVGSGFVKHNNVKIYMVILINLKDGLTMGKWNGYL